jgi:oxygen-dependent protoporphyrinogen oxidase
VVPQVEAGVDKDLVLGDPTAPRFVYWDKKLRPTPSGLDVITFDLLSIWGKIRAGLGAAGILKAPRPEGAAHSSHTMPQMPIRLALSRS